MRILSQKRKILEGFPPDNPSDHLSLGLRQNDKQRFGKLKADSLETIVKNQKLTGQTGLNKLIMTIRKTNEMIRMDKMRRSESDFRRQIDPIRQQKRDRRRRPKSHQIAMTSECDQFDFD
jgi:hypothetical protein